MVILKATKEEPSSRREEFLRSLDDKHCVYLRIEADGQTAGIVKLVGNCSLRRSAVVVPF